MSSRDSEQLYLELADGRKFSLPRSAEITVTDAGLLTVKDDDCSTVIYSPGAWLTLKKRNPAAMAARILTGSKGIPDSPEGLID